jgi:DNA-binding NarL/FixJ family response regulator
MALLIFLPHDQPYLVLHSPLTPEELVYTINHTLWQPPPAYITWLRMLHTSVPCTSPCASLHDNTVIVTPGFVRSKPNTGSSDDNPSHLTRRQREILQALVDGLTIRQIATRMGVHPSTITYHINQLKSVFGTRSLVQSIARLASLLDPHGK